MLTLSISQMAAEETGHPPEPHLASFSHLEESPWTDFQPWIGYGEDIVTREKCRVQRYILCPY